MKTTRQLAILALLTSFQDRLSPSVTKDIQAKHNDAYIGFLEDLPIESIKMALKSFDCTFYPSSGEIRNKSVRLSIPDIPLFSDAWKEVQEVIGKHGYTRIIEKGIVFSHPAIQSTVDALSLHYLCYTTDENAYTRFRDIYNAYTERGINEATLLHEVKEYKALMGDKIKLLADSKKV